MSDLPARPKVMGILNVTPDSFSDGGRFATVEASVQAGVAMHRAGAAIIDIGGESTRPGAVPVPLAEELRRTIPVVEGLTAAGVPVSIDTLKAEVMRRAVQAGAVMLNDVSALRFDPQSLRVAADSNAQVVLVHMLGEPQTMQRDPHYDDVLSDVLKHLNERIRLCEEAGIARSRLIVDPGIGFGKTLDHNLALLHGLETFHQLGVEVMLAASRKAMISAIVGECQPQDRLAGSLALALRGAAAHVHWVRVHDVPETVAALKVFEAIGGVAEAN